VAAARFELYALTRPGIPRARRESGVPVTWRLLSGNNRDLGRAAASFPDVAGCLAAIQRLRVALASPAISVSSPDGRSRWTWRIAVDPPPGGAQAEPVFGGAEHPQRFPRGAQAEPVFGGAEHPQRLPGAVSSRVYQRRVQAESACAVFLSLAAAAPVAGVVRLVGSGRAARL
jgi:hypothetical protein